MLGWVARAALFASLAFLLASVAFAGTAHAMPAGFCDDRGATAIASPPTLEPPQSALERARAGCGGTGGPVRATIVPARRAHGATSAASVEWALPSSSVIAVAPMAPCLDEAPAERAFRSDDERVRIERPPRGQGACAKP